MIDLNLLKLSNIFGQQQPSPNMPNGGSQMPNQQSNDSPDLMSMIQGLLNPKDQQFNRFEDLINQQPQRSDYQPSKMRQIAAAIAGLGAGGPMGISGGQPIGYKSDVPTGMKIQESIKNEPYNKALTDWSNKIEPASKIAQMEQTRNVGNRTTAIGALQRKTAQEHQDESERVNLEKERQGQEKIEISRQRAEAYTKAKQFGVDHPDYKALTDENGDVVFWNPKDPTSEPIPSGIKQITPMEKADLQIQGRLAAIKAQSSANQDLESTRQTNRATNESTRQTNKIELKRTNPNTDKQLLPTQVNKAQVNKANQIISQNPELKNYFIFDKEGVHILPRTFPFNNEDKRLKAYNLLFGENKSTTTSTNKNDKVLMTSPDGRKGYVPSSQVEAAKKQGYK